MNLGLQLASNVMSFLMPILLTRRLEEDLSSVHLVPIRSLNTALLCCCRVPSIKYASASHVYGTPVPKSSSQQTESVSISSRPVSPPIDAHLQEPQLRLSGWNLVKNICPLGA